MSGNPFRRSVQPQPLDAASAGLGGSHVGRDEWPPAALNFAAPAKTKKAIRVASPPPPSPPDASSPEPADALVRRLTASHHPDSPPPVEPGDDPADDMALEHAEDAALTPNTSGTRATRMDALPRLSGIINPFQRTLATIEPAGRQNTRQTGSVGSAGREAAVERPAMSTARGALDVESFKRLLLTGKAAPFPPGTASTTTAPPKQATGIAELRDSSSSTDTSSTSRQSLFESVLEAHHDSPRSSYERSISDGGNDDDQSTLVGEAQRRGKQKPPPPRHKHGKSIASRAPQVVSFADFSPSFASPGTSPSSSITVAGPAGSPSDTNKPLPPRPRASSANKEKDVPSIKPPDSPPQRRRPPNPPLARRYSQLKSASAADSRSRSNSAATLSSQPEEPFSDPPTTSPPSSKAPPPPPARRSGATASTSASASVSDLTATPSRSSSRRSTASSMHNPNTRPSHHMSGSALDSSGTGTASNPPPPLPPKRGSSKSSFDLQRPSASILAAAAGSTGSASPVDSRRPSTEFIKGRSRTASGASGERVVGGYAPVEEKEEGVVHVVGGAATDDGAGVGAAGGSVDLLSEMDRLQREVEALKEKYRRTS